MAKNDKVEELTEVQHIDNDTNGVSKGNTKGHFGRNVALLMLFLLIAAGAVGVNEFRKNNVANQQVLAELQNKYEQKMSAINAHIASLQNEVDELKNRPLSVKNEGVSADFVNHRLQQLKQEMLENGTAESNINESVKYSEEIVTNKKAQEILLASGAMIVRNLAEEGNRFDYEAEVLQILAQGNYQAERYVDVMRRYAFSGIKGRNYLIKSYNKIFAELNDAAVKPAEMEQTQDVQSWQDKILFWVKKLFISKKGSKRPVFTAENDEVYVLVNEGHFGDALNALGNNEKYMRLNSQPLRNWQNQVIAYLEFNHAVDSLIMNCLANLHLKEMERLSAND